MLEGVYIIFLKCSDFLVLFLCTGKKVIVGLET